MKTETAGEFHARMAAAAKRRAELEQYEETQEQEKARLREEGRALRARMAEYEEEKESRILRLPGGREILGDWAAFERHMKFVVTGRSGREVRTVATMPVVTTPKTATMTGAGGSPGSLTGYAVRFNSPSEILRDANGGFIEKVSKGAFAKAINPDVAMVWSHDHGTPLARVRGGSLRLAEDETGLAFSATLANTGAGRDAAELVRTRVVSQMSFAFIVKRESWRVTSGPDGKHLDERTILEVARLLEISPVLYPAYPTASVALVMGA